MEHSPVRQGRMCGVPGEPILCVRNNIPGSAARRFFKGHKAYGRVRVRLAHSLRTDFVFLVKLDREIHLDRWYEPRLVSELAVLEAPVVCTSSCLYHDQTPGLRDEKDRYIHSDQYLAKRNRPVRERVVKWKKSVSPGRSR